MLQLEPGEDAVRPLLYALVMGFLAPKRRMVADDAVATPQLGCNLSHSVPLLSEHHDPLLQGHRATYKRGPL